MTVFVSYSGRARDAVKSLSQDLPDAGDQVRMDQRRRAGKRGTTAAGPHRYPDSAAYLKG
jgi:hypothetical protein